MDKVLSARMDEAVIKRLGMLARICGTSKKAILERAVTELAERLESENEIDELELSFGAWNRDETPDQTRSKARAAFNSSMERRHR